MSNDFKKNSVGNKYIAKVAHSVVWSLVSSLTVHTPYSMLILNVMPLPSVMFTNTQVSCPLQSCQTYSLLQKKVWFCILLCKTYPFT